MFTIEDAKRVQRDLCLGEFHVVHYDMDEGWVMAHTDAERSIGMDLTTCDVHKWMTRCCWYLEQYFPVLTTAGWFVLARQPGKKELLVTGLAL